MEPQRKYSQEVNRKQSPPGGGEHILKDRLKKDRIESFVKTSGGKWLHAVAHLNRRTFWKEMKRVHSKTGSRDLNEEPRWVCGNDEQGETKRKNLH